MQSVTKRARTAATHGLSELSAVAADLAASHASVHVAQGLMPATSSGAEKSARELWASARIQMQTTSTKVSMHSRDDALRSELQSLEASWASRINLEQLLTSKVAEKTALLQRSTVDRTGLRGRIAAVSTGTTGSEDVCVRWTGSERRWWASCEIVRRRPAHHVPRKAGRCSLHRSMTDLVFLCSPQHVSGTAERPQPLDHDLYYLDWQGVRHDG
eukprot:COSAG05_NODE_3845_length_1809_cov_1.533918_3_plen_214_part_01